MLDALRCENIEVPAPPCTPALLQRDTHRSDRTTTPRRSNPLIIACHDIHLSRKASLAMQLLDALQPFDRTGWHVAQDAIMLYTAKDVKTVIIHDLAGWLFHQKVFRAPRRVTLRVFLHCSKEFSSTSCSRLTLCRAFSIHECPVHRPMRSCQQGSCRASTVHHRAPPDPQTGH